MCPYLGIGFGIPDHGHLDDDCVLSDADESRVRRGKVCGRRLRMDGLR